MEQNESDADDRIFCSLLNEVCEPARSVFAAIAEEQKTGVWVGESTSQLSGLSMRVQRGMMEHPKFREERSLFFYQTQLILGPLYQAQNILSVAVANGPSQAVEWYNRLYRKEECDLIYCAEIRGLKIEEEISLSNGLSLMPLQNMPP